MTSSRKPRPRTQQRKQTRDERKLLVGKVKLAMMSEGGSPSRPIEVESSSVVESRARSLACLACGEPPRVLAHEAVVEGTARMRRVTVVCGRCAQTRVLYFKLTGSPLN